MEAQAVEQTDSVVTLFGGTMMAPVLNPYPVYRRLRTERPAVCLKGILGPTHLVTRYDHVLAGLKDGKTFSSRGNARGIGLVMGRTILEMEGPEHVRHRKIVTPFFSPRALRESVEAVVVEKVHGLIDEFARDGQADLVRQFTFTFPLRVMAHIIGIPIQDFDQFHRWALDLLSISDDPKRGFDAAALIVEYLKPIMEVRRREPRNDLLSALTHAEVDGERLSDEEILSFLRLLLPAGAETTYRLSGSTLFALLTHPHVREEVVANPSRIDAVIEETLRWESPVQYTSREATVQVEFDGCEVPEGGLIMFAIGSANRDERHWDRPDEFILDRPNLGDHLAFGFGEHYCAGSFLGRLEARVAVQALLERLPNLRLAAGETPAIVGLAFRSPDRLPVRFDPQ
ncbi:MAG TPA: cytochrome P450 [Candidatus Limnocylindria bacterium]|nr:cytochrome P450 [Candidatus Limnocylindria bacterium]